MTPRQHLQTSFARTQWRWGNQDLQGRFMMEIPHTLRRDFFERMTILMPGGAGMVIYVDVVILLNFLVDWLLLMGTNRLCGYPAAPGRTALAGGAGGVYAGVCLVKSCSFLAGPLWRTVMLAVVAGIAFGTERSTLCRGAVFLLLSFALGGFVSALQSRSAASLVLASGGVFALCIAGFGNKIATAGYVPVELTYGACCLKLTALRDTGNALKDPVTGSPVLVVDAASAQKLTGLTNAQLRQPLASITALPGLRLIPYRSVGIHSGMLLGMKLQHVKIGRWEGSYVVAFAPNTLSTDGTYQALTGGMM